MPDQRQHRGPHPADAQSFAAGGVPNLCAATGDLSWLLTRGYPPTAALKLVGDRFSLAARQRLAIARCACGDDLRARRQQTEISIAEVRGGEMWIDGYNVLTSIEAALSGGVILHAHDGCYRDMASMHGSYRKVAETIPAIQMVGEVLAACGAAECRWLLDQPVSNSGRLKTMLRRLAGQHDWPWRVELVPNPDPLLAQTAAIVATADSQILNRARRWFNLVKTTIDQRIPDAWLVDLSQSAH